ncbi:MAG: thioredoxin domain-containing protein [Candidatus Atabeyarchaeum deiterrae]
MATHDGSSSKGTNRLIHEKSPYLLQHAHNPVDWYPWGQEAFDKSKKENKPIFLSIGYSACHWCHVMEKESFEDLEVARLLNESFVCIKVDREERPDIDNAYMKACEMMTGSSGWPLTIIMTPERKPFYAATYIPRDNMYGRVGLIQLIPRISELWASSRNKLIESAGELTMDLLRSEMKSDTFGEEKVGMAEIDAAYDLLLENFDEMWGGFGSGTKFPTPHNLTFLLRYCKRKKSEKARQMVEKTLDSMYLGGIHDHIGFGFHRYSVDRSWFVPHFEKMLYDQAMLTMAYAEAYQVIGKREYLEIVDDILTFVSRDMTSPEGGFYSSIDADNEGREGAFYLWTKHQIDQTLSHEEAKLVAKVFNVEEEGNLSKNTTKKLADNIMYMKKPPQEIASDLGTSTDKLANLIEVARSKLFAVREKRVHPNKDDKILTDWNGLMIAALAKAAQSLEVTEYRESAKGAADFILSKMLDSTGRLYHRYKDGEAAIPALLDDYAFLVWGLIELYETTFQAKYLKSAIELTEQMVSHFWDEGNGAFYMTANDVETAFIRRKEFYDGPYPSGNSVATLNLLRLAHMAERTDFEQKATGIMQSAYGAVFGMPSAYTQMLTAVDFAIGPTSEVVIVGRSDAKDTEGLLKAVRGNFLPNKVVIFKPTEEENVELTALAEFTIDLVSKEGKATAYVCRDYKCSLPTTDASKMLKLLNPNDP